MHILAARSMPCSSLSMADDLIVSKHDRSLHSPFFHAPLKRWTLVSFAIQLTHHSWLSTALNFELHHPPSERETTRERRKSWFDLHDNSSSTANLSSTRTAIDQLRSSFQSAFEQCRGSLESLDFCWDFSPLQQVQSHHEKIEAWNCRD